MTSLTYLWAAIVAALLGFVLPEPTATIANVIATITRFLLLRALIYHPRKAREGVLL